MAATLVVAGCSSGGGKQSTPPFTLVAPRTTVTLTLAPPPAVTTTTGQKHDGTLDLHTVDWKNIAVPGPSCLHTADIPLRSGRALLPDNVNGHPTKPGSNGPCYDDLEAGTAVAYGDFEGDGHDDAAVALDCNNNGGTADGLLLDSFAVYSGRTGTRTHLGLITPRHQPKDVLPTLPDITSIKPGVITVREFWYGPNDSTCCPSGRAITTWSLDAGKVTPVSSKVTASPERTSRS